MGNGVLLFMETEQLKLLFTTYESPLFYVLMLQKI